MRVNALSRKGTAVYVAVEQSRNDEGRMFISSPNIVEMTADQVADYIQALKSVAGNIWPGRF